MRDLLMNWTQCSRAERVVMFMTRPELLQLKEDRSLNIKSTAGAVDALRKRVADALQKQEFPEDCPEEEDDASLDFLNEDVSEECLVEILKSAFCGRGRKGYGTY